MRIGQAFFVLEPEHVVHGCVGFDLEFFCWINKLVFSDLEEFGLYLNFST